MPYVVDVSTVGLGVIASKPLEVAVCEVDGIRWTLVFYESGLAINVLNTLARQKSKLTGTIRGSFFVINGEY